MNGEHTKSVKARTEDQCGHTPLFAQDPVRWVERIRPCLFCENDRLRKENADLRNHVFNGVGLMQWYLDHYGSTDAQSHETRVWIATKIGDTP